MSRTLYAQAFNSLENAITLDPDLGLAHLVHAKLLLTVGLDESADEVRNTLTGIEFTNAEGYVDRGVISAFFGEYDSAFADFAEAIRISPEQANFYNARGKTYANISDFDSALDDLNTAIAMEPTEAKYLINRGVVYDIISEPELALADFQSALSITEIEIPGPVRRNSEFFATYTDTTSTEAETRHLQKWQTERTIQREIDFYSSKRLGDSDYAFALQSLGERYLKLELWDNAASSLSRLVDLFPNTPETYRFRGNAYLALNRFADANRDYDQAVKLNPSDHENFVARGKGHAGIGEFESAREDFAEAIRLDSNSSEAYKLRGYLLVQTGDSSSAFTDINRAIEISPLDDDAYFKRANAYISLNESSLALKDLNQAITLAPMNADYLYSRGLLQFGLAEYESAFEDFNGAIGLQKFFSNTDRRHARSYVQRGRTYLAIGNPEKAFLDGTTAVRKTAKPTDTSEYANTESELKLILADARELISEAASELQ